MSEREREMFYLTTHSTHFIYGYMASDMWLWTILITRKETRCCHIGYSYRLTARVLLYASSHRQDNTYHGLCYTSRGALAGTRNSPMGPPIKDRSDDPSRSCICWIWNIKRSHHSEPVVKPHLVTKHLTDGLCYTSRGALAGTGNSNVKLPCLLAALLAGSWGSWGGSRTPRTEGSWPRRAKHCTCTRLSCRSSQRLPLWQSSHCLELPDKERRKLFI